jgi:hypothetical protein
MSFKDVVIGIVQISIVMNVGLHIECLCVGHCVQCLVRVAALSDLLPCLSFFLVRFAT